MEEEFVAELRLRLEVLLEDERLPLTTRDVLEPMYTTLLEAKVLEDTDVERMIETVALAEAEIEGVEALMELEKVRDSELDAKLIGVSLMILLQSPLPPSTKEKLSLLLQKIETGERFTPHEMTEIEALIDIAQKEIEAADVLRLLSQTTAEEYLVAITEEALTL